MFKSIFLKEFLKIKYYLLFSFLFSVVVLAYFTFKLNFEFSTIEPESMMWYRFVQLEQKPYFNLIYFYLIFASPFCNFSIFTWVNSKKSKSYNSSTIKFNTKCFISYYHWTLFHNTIFYIFVIKSISNYFTLLSRRDYSNNIQRYSFLFSYFHYFIYIYLLFNHWTK